MFERKRWIVFTGFFVFTLLNPCLNLTAQAQQDTENAAPDAVLEFGIKPPQEVDEFAESYDDIDEEYSAETKDPFENFNRGMHKFNDVLFENVMRPAAITYSNLADEDMRGIVGDFFSNIRMPVRLVSSVVQGDMEKAGRTLVRFFINSTIGLGGLVDVAKTEFHIDEVDEDFDQALGAHGVGTGPYLVWPLIGPATLRGTVGRIVDSALNPARIVSPGIVAEVVMGAVDKVNETANNLNVKDEIDDMAVDSYLSMRDLYLQHRKGMLVR